MTVETIWMRRGMMYNATYVGPRPQLRGETALVKTEDPTEVIVLAQFDNVKDHPDLSHGWHPCMATDWELGRSGPR